MLYIHTLFFMPRQLTNRMKKALPAYYYLDHFHEFLAYFDAHAHTLLDEQSRQFISAFRALCTDQQCLIARAANRKYALINRTQFNYAEINQPQQHLDDLTAQGWFADMTQASIQDIAGVVTKDTLLACLAEFPGVSGVASKKKAELVSLLYSLAQTHGWPAQLPTHDYLVKQFEPTLRYLLFLYFGNTRGRLNQFSMRDLGIMRTREDATGTAARFDSGEDAAAAFFYARGLDELSYLSTEQKQACGRRLMPETNGPLSLSLAEKYQHKLGMQLLDSDRALGLQVLQQAPGDAAKEKWLREYYKEGHKEAVKAELESIIDNPPSDSLLAFAEDFYTRKYHKKRTSVMTDMLRSASRQLALDISQNQSVEQGVVGWYKRHGATAWRTENRPWRVLFGLTFWQLLFEKDSLVTEFDRRPQSLKYNTFYQQFGEEIEALLGQLSTAAELRLHLTRQASAQFGKVNSVFMWRQNLLDTVNVMLEHIPFDQIMTIMRMMCKDFAALSDGFPDIMVVENGQVRFEEIKAPGDVLRRNQLITIQRMQQAGMTVNITQVEWVQDPLQPYVVVDIETTGGKQDYHRITEIGMVKMINGEVVDSWQSLINPQRSIPSSITRLTGIDNAMVAGAPTFADVADEVEAFTQDCVFVAHNVNFDYGFFKLEFARLDRLYRRPKLCTVVQMRRACPGLSSYSLAALTKHFGIDMQRHHRAMSDARAAASLLNIIHERTASYALT